MKVTLPADLRKQLSKSLLADALRRIGQAVLPLKIKQMTRHMLSFLVGCALHIVDIVWAPHPCRARKVSRRSNNNYQRDRLICAAPAPNPDFRRGCCLA